MNLAAVASLPLVAETGTWYRAVALRFLPAALSTRHTPQIFSRFSPGPLGQPPFEILYLAENQQVALFEVQALFGTPWKPGALVPNPAGSWAAISVRVHLSAIADLTTAAAQQSIDTSAQELTGDWQGYQVRGPGLSVSQPIGIAPTQQLGEALASDPRIEGFRTLSAKVPYHRILAIFPGKLLPGSQVVFEYQDARGNQATHTIP